MTTVLCRLPNHVGDCCMCLPALRLLEASGFTPALVGKRWAEDLVAGMGWRFDPIEGHLMEDLARIRFVARNAGAKTGMLFPNSFSSALLFVFARIKSAGLATDYRSFLLNKRIPEPDKQIHEVERFFYAAHEAIRAWGGTPAWDKPPKSLGLVVLKRHESAAKNLIAQYGIPKRFALLAPVARGLHKGRQKHWPHFNDLCKPLRDLGIEPVVFPSVREESLAKQLCPDAMHLPPTSLGNYAAIAKYAQFVIANDSGISHIAAALGLKQITLVGVTDVERTGPWNPQAVVLGADGSWPDVPTVLRQIEKIAKQNRTLYDTLFSWVKP